MEELKPITKSLKPWPTRWPNDEFADILSPRSCTGDAEWEMQRLRGRVTAHLGFDAVEMEDEHGTSYLIFNPLIKGS